MTSTIINNAELLRTLYKLKPYHRSALLIIINNRDVHCLCECIHNTLQGKVPLSTVQKQKLSKHKITLRKLVQRGGTWKKKKRILVQKGGAILPLILGPLLSGVLGSLFK